MKNLENINDIIASVKRRITKIQVTFSAPKIHVHVTTKTGASMQYVIDHTNYKLPHYYSLMKDWEASLLYIGRKFVQKPSFGIQKITGENDQSDDILFSPYELWTLERILNNVSLIQPTKNVSKMIVVNR